MGIIILGLSVFLIALLFFLFNKEVPPTQLTSLPPLMTSPCCCLSQVGKTNEAFFPHCLAFKYPHTSNTCVFLCYACAYALYALIHRINVMKVEMRHFTNNIYRHFIIIEHCGTFASVLYCESASLLTGVGYDTMCQICYTKGLEGMGSGWKDAMPYTLRTMCHLMSKISQYSFVCIHSQVVRVFILQFLQPGQKTPPICYWGTYITTRHTQTNTHSLSQTHTL